MKKILFIILMILLFPLQINAANKINIDCDSKNLKVGDSTLCVMTGHSNYEVAGLAIKLAPSPSIKIKSLTTSSIWEGDGNDNFILLYTDNNKIGKFEIASFEIEKISDEKLYMDLSEIIFVDKEFKENNLDDVRLYIDESRFDLKIILIILSLIFIFMVVKVKLKKSAY